jgi:ribosomal protein S18 acetylase RimI-like enzyme
LSSSSYRIRERKSVEDIEFFEMLDYESFKIEFIRDDSISEEEARKKYLEFTQADPLDPWSSDHQVFFAESVDGQLMGLVWLAKRDPFYVFKESIIWIYNLHVIPQYRGLGVARSLLLKAEECAKSEKLSKIGLHVMDFNTAAKSLYLSMGYEQTASHNDSLFYQKILY